MANTPAPIFNHRKRPRQSLIADPQQNFINQPGPGPAGAASYNDLMPVGGFRNMNQKVQQQPNRNTTPNSGQGAAFFSRHSYNNNNNQGNQPTNQVPTNYGGPSSKKQSFNRNSSFSSCGPTSEGQQNNTYRSNQNNQTSQNRGNQWGPGAGNNYGQSNQQQTFNNRPGNQRVMSQYSGRIQPNPTGFRGQQSTQWYNNNNNNYNNNNNNNRGQQSTSWNNNNNNSNRINQNCTNQRYNQQTARNFNQQGNNGTNMYGQPGNGRNTKMVATSSSGHMNSANKGGNSSFSNNAGTSAAGGNRLFNNNPGNSGASSQYRFKPSNTGIADQAASMDEWDSSFDENFTGQNNTTPANKQTKTITVKNKQSQQDSGLHLLTVNVSGMKRWSKFKDTVLMLFEMFGVLDSAVTKSTIDSKEFLLRDEEKNSVKCVFFEIDRQIPKMTRGMVYRVVGTYDKTKDLLKCSSIRSTTEAERALGSKLVQMCAKSMMEETRNLREM